MFTGDGVGGSGDFLMAALHRAGFANLTTSRGIDDGLELRDAYIVAAVRCAPPDNKPTNDEIATCRDHLQREMAALPRVRVVVALGKIAFDTYLRLQKANGIVASARPVFAHGSRTRLSDGRLLLGSYHPSRQNTNTGKLTAAMLSSVFREARRLVGRPGSSLAAASS
jgi:uracil-DNA glycosylase family 4